MKLVQLTKMNGEVITINPYMLVSVEARGGDSGASVLKLWDITFDVRESYTEVTTKLQMALNG